MIADLIYLSLIVTKVSFINVITRVIFSIYFYFRSQIDDSTVNKGYYTNLLWLSNQLTQAWCSEFACISFFFYGLMEQSLLVKRLKRFKADKEPSLWKTTKTWKVSFKTGQNSILGRQVYLPQVVFTLLLRIIHFP